MKLIPNLKTSNRIFLAPMEEVNDIAFRILCKKAGAGLTFTGMIHPLYEKEIYLTDSPILQLFGNSDEGIEKFIKKYDDKVSGWDFNLGCPAKTAKKHYFGSFLSDLEKIEKILSTMRNSTRKPIIIKLRKTKQTPKILKLAKKYCDAVCIHPRTISQGYSGIPDLKFAEKIKSKTNLPVIYSGNVTKENAPELLKKFDYVMIGREAIGRPNIFNFFSDKKTNFTFKDYLNLAEKYDFPFRQLKFQAMNFTKGRENSAEMRLKIAKIKRLKELKEFVGKEEL